MFGNELTDEQRQTSLMTALGITGIAGAARYMDQLQRNNVSKHVKSQVSRVEELRSKYGHFSTEEIHQRINLRGEVHKELDKLIKNGLSKKARGPALAGVYDKKTDQFYFATNNVKGLPPEELHPLIKGRLDDMPTVLKEGYIKTAGAGSHAEVIALNNALLKRPDARLSETMIYVVSARKINKDMSQGVPMPRCPHCEYITNGAKYIPEVLQYGKKQ